MASNSGDFTPQQYRKYNGQSVFKALSAIGTEASADELANFISEDIGANKRVILPEIRNVLRRGITNGFLQRNGEYYSFITDDYEMQVDSVPSRRRQRSVRETPKRKSSSNVEREENVSEDEELGEEEETDEDENVYDNREEMDTDSSAMPHPPKVKLYERYSPPDNTDDEENEEYDEDDYNRAPPQKRVRLTPILKRRTTKQ